LLAPTTNREGTTTFAKDSEATTTSQTLDVVSTTTQAVDTTDPKLWISLTLTKALNNGIRRRARVVKGRTSPR
jgi:hypothetical protein